MIATTNRLRAAIEAFLDACEANQVAFEPERAYATQAEAEAEAFELTERLHELYRVVGREPPASRQPPQESTLI